MREPFEGHPPIPDNYHTAPDFGEVLYKEIDAFFEAIISYIGYNQRARNHFAQRTIRNLAFTSGASMEGIRDSDEFIHLLFLGSRLAASVLEIRTEFNFIDAFFSSHLTPETVAKMREGVVEGFPRQDNQGSSPV